jgi:lipopolysaccharide/colanic/teichoic acid biosynthesis glycosyltransferase
VKRLLDIGASGALLLLLSPLFLLIGVAVILSDGTPVFYRQQRAGRHGKAFGILKFRTMKGAPASAITHGENDPRITPIGKVLRRRRLDELPQLLNVLAGQMSMVGPRPEALEFVETDPTHSLAPLWREVLSVRPGVTGPDALAFKNEGEELASNPDPEAHYRQVILPKKLAVQSNYVRTQSLVKDVRILFRTLGVLRG